MWWNGDWGWGASVVMTITMLGFWALVAWVITSLVRGIGGGGERRSEADAILAERFARGEIEEEEYRRRRDLIRAAR